MLLAIPLLAHAYVGLYSRYVADDYCTAGQVATRGLLGLELTLYEVWSGRFAFTFLVGLVELIGSGATRVLPGLALVFWVGALTLALSRFGRLLRWRLVYLEALVLAEVILLATLASTPDPGQSLYWQTGMLTYLAPLVLLALYIGWVTERVRVGAAGPRAMALAAALACVAGGTSETYVAAQTVGLGLAAVLSLVGGRRVLVSLVVAGLIGSVVALVIIALAPGNAVRGGGVPTPNLPNVLGAAIDDARQLFHDFWRFSTLSAAVAFLVPGLVAFVAEPPALSRRQLRRLLLWSLLVGLVGCVLVVVCLVPSFYALSAPAPGRARIIPQLLLVGLAAMGGYLCGATLRVLLPSRPLARVAAAAALVGLAIVGPLLTTRAVLAQEADARAYAERWDGIDALVRTERAGGQQDVVVPPLPAQGSIKGMDFVSQDPSDWLNVCVARYYGLRSIAAARN
jgi:hypothetical protein